jgi:hypothetical protein
MRKATKLPFPTWRKQKRDGRAFSWDKKNIKNE